MNPDTLQSLIYLITLDLSLTGPHLHSHQIGIKATQLQGVWLYLYRMIPYILKGETAALLEWDEETVCA